MSDRTDSIHALQRAARSHGRREAATRAHEPSPRRRGPGASIRSAALAARDGAHYHVLRAGELLADLPQRTRRIAAGAGAATLLLVVVLTATAGADADKRDAATASAPKVAAAGPRGSRADETLIGSSAADRINGRAGDDVILAGAGNDILSGATGNDVLHGAGGDDILFAGPGRDVLIGAAGDDQLRATNLDGERDRLHCGAGNDVAWVVARRGRVEDVTTGCERVNVIDVRATRRLG
jgi:hypothetical protein